MTTLGPRRRDRLTAAAPTRHGQLRKSHPVAGVFRLLGIALAVVLVAAVSVGGVAVWQVTSSIKSGVKLTDSSGKAVQPPPEIGAIDGGVNLLLAGTDTRTGQGGQFSNKADQAASSGAGNNDVTMLLHISEDHTNATVISFPRDLMIPIPACPRPNGGTVGATSVAMFNTTLSRGGINCTVLTVQKMTGLKIPFAATISFDGVIGMSDAVGGVTVCLADPLKDPYVGLDLPAGTATLQGSDALAFVRSRHGVGDGSDLGRISNQQVFLSALSRKLTSGGVLGNPVQLYSIAKTAANNMELTDGLSNPSTMVQIALALKDIGLGNITFLQYPTASDPSNPNRVVPIASSAAVLNAALVADKPIQLSGQIGRAAELDPNATAVPSASPTPTPTKGGKTPTPTPSPTATAAAEAPVVLPSTITGQTAAQQTCSKRSN
ncbi:LCP family protein [Lacisediminihabitans changchengi]|uniref:LCP family protein n=1 Tax=Lacisediminihabitans changchengi TaxID=2787634 RepID=A0A934W3F7_9MICO|nr:LCP family protein [Lacisediminihabitans changchengi]MBK4347164.1 LCP family protein [Lacisediminihabitans changchengi]